MNNHPDARLVHMADQAIARITSKLDSYREQAAVALPTLGYESTVAQMHGFLVTTARKHPDAIAALAAVAIVSDAQTQQTQIQQPRTGPQAP